MKSKTSIRYFLDKPIRTIWDETNSMWWFSATDVVAVLANSQEPRRYWNNLKSRHQELANLTVRHKLYSNDGKKYLSDTINEQGIKELALFIPSKNRVEFHAWLKGSLDPIDEQSKRRAYELFNNSLIAEDVIGTTICLQQIHAYLFGGLYDFAGKIRTKTISKGGFTFANGQYLSTILKDIDKMPDSDFISIINKYVEMNVTHPFMEGNGRATRIWLDLLLKKRLSQCIDWSRIDKNDYLLAMQKSPTNPSQITNLLKGALTSKIDNREIFMKGIDCSYYYEKE